MQPDSSDCDRPYRLDERWVVLVYAGLLVGVFVALADYELLDDAYFFKRFAHNIVEHGVGAWNVDDGPVHGNTSQLFQVVAAGIHAIAPNYTFVAVKALSCLALVGCLVLLVSNKEPLRGPWPWLAMAAPPVVMTSHTGMETALTFLVLALGLSWSAPAGGPGHPAVSAVWCWLGYLVRPDAALLAAVPALAAHADSRRSLVVFAAALTALMLLSWAGFAAYYGTPLPMAFYWKTQGLSTYGASLIERHSDTPRNLTHFMLYAAPLAYVAAHRLDRRNVALMAGAGLFVAYHVFATLEIMGHFGRFYVPAYVPLALAAGRAHRDFAAAPRGAWAFVVALGLGFVGAHAAGVLQSDLPNVPEPFVPWAWLVAAAGFLVLPQSWGRMRFTLGVPAVLAVTYVVSLAPSEWGDISDDAVVERSRTHYRFKYRGLDVLRRALEGPLVVYHTDIGVPGLYLIESRVVDLDGLMNPEVLEGAAFDVYCQRDRPHAIFVPMKHYVQRRREILESTCLEDYLQVEKSRTPLYVRRDLVEDYRRAR